MHFLDAVPRMFQNETPQWRVIRQPPPQHLRNLSDWLNLH